MKIYVNSKSFVGISPEAIHFYPKLTKFESDKDIYVLANSQEGYFEAEEWETIDRVIDAKEAKMLNKREGRGGNWKAGDTTIKYNSMKEVKDTVLAKYPEADVVFFFEHDLESEDMDVFKRTVDKVVYTGEVIKIEGFEGFSSNFKTLTEGSIHKVIETPKRYIDKDLQEGKWVEGDYEPALILRREYVRVTKKN